MYLLVIIPPSGQEDLLGENLRLRGLAGCYALFQYLTVGIQAANAVYSQARERMEELHHTLILDKQITSNEDASLASADAGRSAADSSHTSRHHVDRLASECEAIAVQQAALLRYHNSISVFPLATLRHTLTSALSTWPNSAPLWSIYVQVSHGLVIRYHNSFSYYGLKSNRSLWMSFRNIYLTLPLDVSCFFGSLH